ncbi:hypothetical protein, partial [Bradyrhizobium brasilense]|uniref:hypothetical protein n=1 Tax=Bradyrhizobium brasilense TaxID=1419277 RepID=UPI001AEE3AF4
LAHGLDGCGNIEVGVAQRVSGLAAGPWRSEQRTGLIVATVKQDGVLPHISMLPGAISCLIYFAPGLS